MFIFLLLLRDSVYRVLRNICRIPGIIQLLIEFDNSYNMHAILSLMLKRMIPLAIVVSDTERIGDEPSHYFLLLLELLRTVDLDSSLVDTMIRFVNVLYLRLVCNEKSMSENLCPFLSHCAGKFYTFVSELRDKQKILVIVIVIVINVLLHHHLQHHHYHHTRQSCNLLSVAELCVTWGWLFMCDREAGVN